MFFFYSRRFDSASRKTETTGTVPVQDAGSEFDKYLSIIYFSNEDLATHLRTSSNKSALELKVCVYTLVVVTTFTSR